MTEKYTNVFISSKNRDINETPYNYTCKFPDDVIKCDNNQGIKINIISFDMINQMYNVNINNNRYNIITTYLNDENETIITGRSAVSLGHVPYSLAARRASRLARCGRGRSPVAGGRSAAGRYNLTTNTKTL